jgi:coupling of ubiquitin conjugation to ER degradation protein 1
LGTRVPSAKGKEKARDENSIARDEPGQDSEDEIVTVSARSVSGGGKWEETKEKREMELRERKEKMILEARE